MRLWPSRLQPFGPIVVLPPERAVTDLAEIGTIEMEIAVGSAVTPVEEVFHWNVDSVLGPLGGPDVPQAVTIVEAYFHGIVDDSDLANLILQASIFAGLTASYWRLPQPVGICSSPIGDCSRWLIPIAPGRATAASTHPIRRPSPILHCVPFFNATLGGRLCGSIGASKTGILSCTCTFISPDSACRNWSPSRCRISPGKTGKNWTISCERTSRPCPHRRLIGH